VTLDDWDAMLAEDDGYEVLPAASDAEITQAEKLLGATIPTSLRRLYLMSDGVLDKPGQWFVVWPLAEVVEHNRQAWAVEDNARQQLLGFGDDGTGAPFCVPRDGGGVVFHWNPIDQLAHRLADTVGEFWSGWSNGTITT
jgi:hypothetical protein